MSSLSAQMWHSIVTLPEQLLTALKQLLYFCFGYQWLVCNYRYFSFIHICHRSTTEWGMPSFMLQLWSRRLTPSCRSQESYSAASDLFLCPLLTSSSGEQEVHPGDCWHLSLIIGPGYCPRATAKLSKAHRRQRWKHLKGWTLARAESLHCDPN